MIHIRDKIHNEPVLGILYFVNVPHINEERVEAFHSAKKFHSVRKRAMSLQMLGNFFLFDFEFFSEFPRFSGIRMV